MKSGNIFILVTLTVTSLIVVVFVAIAVFNGVQKSDVQESGSDEFGTYDLDWRESLKTFEASSDEDDTGLDYYDRLVVKELLAVKEDLSYDEVSLYLSDGTVKTLEEVLESKNTGYKHGVLADQYLFFFEFRQTPDHSTEFRYVENFDRQSLSIIDNQWDFIRDSERLFYRGREVEGVNMSKLSFLSDEPYYEDGESVYYGHRALTDLDVGSVSTTSVGGGLLHHDSDTVYYRGGRLSELDPESMVVNIQLGLIYDNDTTYWKTGDCHFGGYTRDADHIISRYGSLAAYKRPC